MRTPRSSGPRRAWIGFFALAAGVPLVVNGSARPGWKVEPVMEAAPASDAPQEARSSGRVERMLENRVACRGCHVIAGRGGRIGPSLDGLGERVDADHVRAVILDPASTVPGTLMPRQRIPDRDLDRLVAYLMQPRSASSLEGVEVTPRAPAGVAPGSEGDGSALYARHCAACHGDLGGGDGWNAPTLPVAPTAHADAQAMGARTDDALFDAIYAGAFVLDGSPRMPPFGLMLSTSQIRALVAHIRDLCGCSQPAWAGSS